MQTVHEVLVLIFLYTSMERPVTCTSIVTHAHNRCLKMKLNLVLHDIYSCVSPSRWFSLLFALSRLFLVMLGWKETSRSLQISVERSDRVHSCYVNWDLLFPMPLNVIMLLWAASNENASAGTRACQMLPIPINFPNTIFDFKVHQRTTR